MSSGVFPVYGCQKDAEEPLQEMEKKCPSIDKEKQ